MPLSNPLGFKHHPLEGAGIFIFCDFPFLAISHMHNNSVGSLYAHPIHVYRARFAGTGQPAASAASSSCGMDEHNEHPKIVGDHVEIGPNKIAM